MYETFYGYMFCPWMYGCICKAQKLGHCATGQEWRYMRAFAVSTPRGCSLTLFLLPQKFKTIPNILTPEPDTVLKTCELRDAEKAPS